MMPHKLYVIADVDAAGGAARLLDAVSDALAAGARMIQLRGKSLSPRQYWDIGLEVASLVAAYGGTFLTNDRADMAVSLDADGVHRVADGMPLRAIRRLVNHDLIGISCHSPEEVIAAEEDGADFVTLSPIFEVEAKPGYANLGLSVLQRCADVSKIPVYALGGIRPEHVADCLKNGAVGVAVMSGIVGAEDPYSATESYLHAIQHAFSEFQ